MIDQIESPTRIEQAIQTVSLGVDTASLPSVRGTSAQALASLSEIMVEVQIGQPLAHDLQGLALAKGDVASLEVVPLLEQHRFFLFELYCSFLPAQNCEITSTRLRVELAEDGRSADVLIHDLYPISIDRPVPLPWKVSLATNFRFYEPATDPLASELLAIVFHRLSPEILGTGLRTSTALWVFQKRGEGSLKGVLPAYLVAQLPCAAERIMLQIEVMVQVATPFVNLPFIPLGKVLRGRSTAVAYTLTLPPVPKSGQRKKIENRGRRPHTALFELLTQHFDLAGLKELCFYLGIDYDGLAGATKGEKVIALLQYLAYRKQISRLIEVGQRLRPEQAWDELGEGRC